MRRRSATRPRWAGVLLSALDPRVWAQLPRLLHAYNYNYVAPLRRLDRGRGVALPPSVSLRAADNISIGDRTRIGAGSSLWAGSTATIRIGTDTLFGPRVFVTVSNYGLDPELAPMYQPRVERSVTIGDGVWLGTGVTVLPGVTIGDGCVVGAGAVVHKSLPPGAVAVGGAVRVVRMRDGSPVAGAPSAEA